MALQTLGTMTVMQAMVNIAEYVGEFVDYSLTRAWTLIRTSVCRDIPNMFIEGDPSVGQEVSYNQQVIRETKRPYTFTHRLRGTHQYITAISCLPIEKRPDIHCPETNVLEGGLNHNYVRICLEPVWRGKWGCNILICNTPE